MHRHQFTLIVDGADLQSADTLNALFEAGCDDGLVGRTGTIQYIDFERQAEQLDQATLSAVAAIETVPGLRVERIDSTDASIVSVISASLELRRYAGCLSGERREALWHLARTG